jgi:hypothetical protein
MPTIATLIQSKYASHSARGHSQPTARRRYCEAGAGGHLITIPIATSAENQSKVHQPELWQKFLDQIEQVPLGSTWCCRT